MKDLNDLLESLTLIKSALSKADKVTTINEIKSKRKKKQTSASYKEIQDLHAESPKMSDIMSQHVPLEGDEPHNPAPPKPKLHLVKADNTNTFPPPIPFEATKQTKADHPKLLLQSPTSEQKQKSEELFQQKDKTNFLRYHADNHIATGIKIFDSVIERALRGLPALSEDDLGKYKSAHETHVKEHQTKGSEPMDYHHFLATQDLGQGQGRLAASRPEDRSLEKCRFAKNGQWSLGSAE